MFVKRPQPSVKPVGHPVGATAWGPVQVQPDSVQASDAHLGCAGVCLVQVEPLRSNPASHIRVAGCRVLTGRVLVSYTGS